MFGQAGVQALLEARMRRAEDVDVNYNLGLICAKEGDYEKAAGFLEQVVSSKPEFVKARRELAVCYVKLRRLEESRRHLEIIKEMDETRRSSSPAGKTEKGKSETGS